MLRENGAPEYVLSSDCVLHYLETSKLKAEPATEVEQWLYLLVYAGKEDEKMKILIDNNEYLKQAMKRYEYFVADEQARLAYEARQKFLHDQASYLGDARREGLAEGHAEGLKEGLEKGFEKGLEKGRAEKQAEVKHEKVLETTEKLLALDLSPEQIAEVTGLSVEEVKSITSSD